MNVMSVEDNLIGNKDTYSKHSMSANEQAELVTVWIKWTIPSECEQIQWVEIDVIHPHSMNNSICTPLTEKFWMEAGVSHSDFVKGWISHEELVVSFSLVICLIVFFHSVWEIWSISLVLEVKYGEPHNWEDRECNVVELINNLLVKNLSRKSWVESEEELSHQV